CFFNSTATSDFYTLSLHDALPILWVGRGRSRAEIRPFFELLGPVRCAQVRAVAMDMNSAYDLEVRAHCPNAEVVYDLFHVVAKYGREVIDRVGWTRQTGCAPISRPGGWSRHRAGCYFVIGRTCPTSRWCGWKSCWRPTRPC